MNKDKTPKGFKSIVKKVCEAFRRHTAVSVTAGVCFLLCIALFVPLVIVAKNGFYIERPYTQVITNQVSSVTSEKSENDDIVTPEVEIADEDSTEDIENNEKMETPESKTEELENITFSDAINTVTSKQWSDFSYGIDVSSHNGKIDWSKVAADGVEFVMIRCGYRGYVTGKIVQDAYFEENIRGAAANNIAIGVYFYSTAINESEARQEAAWVCKIISEKTAEGIELLYPIAYDFEEFYNKQKSRAENLSKQQLTKNTIAFLNYVSESGYAPMLYASKSAVTHYWDFDAVKDYEFWLAHYVEATNYAGEYAMWQYTSRGKVNGIKGYTDFNVSYCRNVYPSEPVECTEDTVNIYNNCSTEAVSVGVMVKDAIYERISVLDTGWSEILYNGFIGYAKTENLKKVQFTPLSDTVTIEENTPFYLVAVVNDEYRVGELSADSTVIVTATYKNKWYQFLKNGKKMYFEK